jgi:hypothetical protein
MVADDSDKAAVSIVKKYAKEKVSESSAWNSYKYWDMISNTDAYLRSIKSLENLQKTILARRGLTVDSDLQPLIEEYSTEFASKRMQYDKLKSDQYRDEVIAMFTDQMKEAASKSQSLEQRVKAFTKHNHLLSCLDKQHTCDLESTNVSAKVIPMEITEQIDQVDIELLLAEAEAEAIEIELLLLAA